MQWKKATRPDRKRGRTINRETQSRKDIIYLRPLRLCVSPLFLFFKSVVEVGDQVFGVFYSY